MCPSPEHDKLIQDALALVQRAASRSQKEEFDSDRPESAARINSFRLLRQKFQQLNELYDKAVAEIRASLDRS